jgi:cell division septum initiation protein DivIVA
MTKRLNDLKTSFDKLRKDSFEVVDQANKIVSQGVHKLAEHELKALNDTYQSVLATLKNSKAGDSVKDVAAKQLDAMQHAVTSLIASARDSMGIIADTRQELSSLLQRGLKTGTVAEKELGKVTAQAQKAVAEIKVAAANAQKKASSVTAQAKASAEKIVSTVKADADKVVSVVKKDVKVARQRVGSVLDVKPKAAPAKKRVVVSSPSADSRAARASSKVKEAASKVATSVKKMG